MFGFISILGNHFFQCYQVSAKKKFEIVSQELVGKADIPSDDFASHCWLDDDTVVLGLKNGDMYFLNNRCEFEFKLSELSKNNASVECLVAIYKGFIAGFENGKVQIYRAYEGDKQMPYIRRKMLEIPSINDDVRNVMIRDMSISPSADQEHLICLTSTNLIFKIKIEKGEKDLEEPKYELISSQAHEGAITCMDICIRKPLIVTCGEDQYIRIWNYKERVQELAKQFPAEDISSVALHPSGFHLLVGFSDKLKYFNIGTERGDVFKQICDF